jgi:hypothetical protein
VEPQVQVLVRLKRRVNGKMGELDIPVGTGLELEPEGLLVVQLGIKLYEIRLSIFLKRFLNRN